MFSVDSQHVRAYSVAMLGLRAMAVAVLAVLSASACSTPPPPPPPPMTCETCPQIIPPDCSVPARLDFGVILIGDTAAQTIVLDNLSSEEQVVTIGRPTSTDFVGNLRDATTLAPGKLQGLTLVWTPTHAGLAAATVTVQRAATCEPVDISLEGEAVDAFLSWTPAIDFGYVLPGIEVVREVTFTNLSTNNVHVGTSHIDAPFRLLTPDVIVPARGSTTFAVAFKPVALGEGQGTFTFSTDLSHQALGSVALRGVGGGPRIGVSPDALDFGLTPGESGLTLQLEVRNDGTRAANGDVAANLHFGTPFFEVEPLNANTLASEFTVALPADYDPQFGLRGGEKLRVDVTLTPTRNGQKSARLTFHSNDLQNPATEVVLSATVVDFPACSYSVSPNPLDFGVGRDVTRTVPITITNTGTTACTLLDASIVQGAPYFTVDNQRVQIASGEKHVLWVNGLGTRTGALRLSMSSATNPQTVVPLSIDSSESCLTVPLELKLGSMQMTCGSGPRVVPIYNLCSAPVTFQLALDGSNEFHVTGLPTGSTTLGPGAPLNLTIDYRPLNVGADVGTLRFSGVQNGRTVQQVMALRGEGTSNGHVDVVHAGVARPEVLLLIVLDDSSTMADEKAALAAAVQRITAFLPQFGLRIGVVDTELSGPTAGVLRQSATGQVWSGFQSEWGPLIQSVALTGTVESCLDPAARVLRRGAPNTLVSVLCVTDSGDQAPYVADAYLTAMNLDRKDLRFNVVGPFAASAPVGCTYDDPNDGRLEAAVTATQGARTEVCGANYDQALADAVLPFTRPRLDYPLESFAIAGSIVVSEDGLAIPQQNPGPSADTIWTYDAARNAVVFEPLYVPEPGVDVNISYTAVCQ